MSLYQSLKQRLVKPIFRWRERIAVYNKAARAIGEVKDDIMKYKIPELTKVEKKIAKSYWMSKGYMLRNTLWHQYYKGITGEFRKEYVPGDIFRSQIAHKLNQMRQWPALLDKNLLYSIFNGFEQPKLIVSNINGFYYSEGIIISKSKAIELILNSQNRLIIKPSIWTGQGKMVKSFSVDALGAENCERKLDQLLTMYKQDFLVQEFLIQSRFMKMLNDSSLNTIRVMSYLRAEEVHIITSVVRIGKSGSDTDNFSAGGIACGLNMYGKFNPVGFTMHGDRCFGTDSGLIFKDLEIPNFERVTAMVKDLHKKVPYFRIISWDIALNDKDKPVLIEYNTYTQGTRVLQIVNGPLFGEFTDKILNEGLR
ncbi:sugar-transfer associated ATP-grasp domain-containing protein [Winogradskyella aurantia]|uniref:Alpha-L-glutamate ligase-related protein ATP-grasp domain-containing protein n=1 Tax=Winogradskyella aurantia TaxID=1915063 RepID=A0A265UXL9_9FLAO|nr:sugar-transfer associated ATP-grasp domain-containing protein [Winogradskyella aurantia]OZV69972.1 hypothetical protein CA834_04970 [Winogradskyella aurantia]